MRALDRLLRRRAGRARRLVGHRRPDLDPPARVGGTDGEVAPAAAAGRVGSRLSLTRARLEDRLRLVDRREDAGDQLVFAGEQPVRAAGVKPDGSPATRSPRLQGCRSRRSPGSRPARASGAVERSPLPATVPAECVKATGTDGVTSGGDGRSVWRSSGTTGIGTAPAPIGDVSGDGTPTQLAGIGGDGQQKAPSGRDGAKAPQVGLEPTIFRLTGGMGRVLPSAPESSVVLENQPVTRALYRAAPPPQVSPIGPVSHCKPEQAEPRPSLRVGPVRQAGGCRGAARRGREQRFRGPTETGRRRIDPVGGATPCGPAASPAYPKSPARLPAWRRSSRARFAGGRARDGGLAASDAAADPLDPGEAPRRTAPAARRGPRPLPRRGQGPPRHQRVGPAPHRSAGSRATRARRLASATPA